VLLVWILNRLSLLLSIPDYHSMLGITRICFPEQLGGLWESLICRAIGYAYFTANGPIFHFLMLTTNPK
jgi:hypothetical protein